MTTNTYVFISAVVLLFVIFLIMLLLVVDHKARLAGGVKRDVFRIAGKRRDHPIWSYLVGTLVLTIIGGVAFELSSAVLERTDLMEKPRESSLLRELDARRSAEAARHFHNPAGARSLEGKKTVCFFCHGDFPHFEQRMVRTLLNMHTQFLACMTCHADPNKVDEQKLSLRWANYSGLPVSGPHFGTDLDPTNGYLLPTDDLFSKIVPYYDEGERESLLEITEDDPQALEFARLQNRLTGREKEAIKKSFHRTVTPKGRFCTRCHTREEKSFIPFRKLGFSEQRIGELTSLNIIGMVQKYKKFYMPNLMQRGALPDDVEALVGPEVDVQLDVEKMRKDPRSWWHENFETDSEDPLGSP
jgi:hypothetical protein